MSDGTDISISEKGSYAQCSEHLFILVYSELRKLAAHKMANEHADHTLQATALVHEAYLRLIASNRDRNWTSRGHFLAAAAEAMRRILVDKARHKQTKRRGGNLKRNGMDLNGIAVPEISDDILAVHEALARFEEIDKPKADLVKLRYFAGLTMAEAAEVLNISSSTADRAWAYARAWLHVELSRGNSLSDLPSEFGEKS